MILSSQTNSVYFSAHLANDYRQLYEAVKSVLQDYQIHVDVLCKTADYWCRDYMPIQVTDNTFVKYKYKPDYLNKRGKHELITNVDEPLSFLNLNDNKFINLSDITIDGGNVVKTPYHVLMTEKIFIENPQYQNKLKLIYRLEKAFQTEIIILPWCNRSQDKCGHTDGMVRFVKDKELLMADYTNFAPRNGKRIRKILEENGYIVHELPLPYTINDSWAYINFLQTSKVILVPGLNLKTDSIALEYLQSLFHSQKIIQIPAPYLISKYGGAFNCMSWNIKE